MPPMQKRKILELPLASTAFVRDPTLCTDGSDVTLTMDFDDEGQTRSVSLRFTKQRALRKRAEGHCTAWHIADTFDTVCEVHESDWVRELREATQREFRDHWILRHFIIYVDSFGCLEVVAESVSLDTAT